MKTPKPDKLPWEKRQLDAKKRKARKKRKHSWHQINKQLQHLKRNKADVTS